jgi:hypothetical protein
MTMDTAPKLSMLSAGCANCRVRFTRAEAAYLGACPVCDRPIGQFASLDQFIGFPLHSPEPLTSPPATAVAISLPVPGLGGERS